MVAAPKKIHKPRRVESRKISFYKGALDKEGRAKYRKTYAKTMAKAHRGKLTPTKYY